MVHGEKPMQPVEDSPRPIPRPGALGSGFRVQDLGV